MFVDNDSMTMGEYVGPTPRHYLENSSEFQYIVEGKGTEWLSNKTIALKLGMLQVIPRPSKVPTRPLMLPLPNDGTISACQLAFSYHPRQLVQFRLTSTRE